jgi:DNA topoisomerase-2
MSSSQLILDSSREYSIYVCANRAIPAIEDGMKAGQRVAMWLLAKRAEQMKTIALGGLMLYERLYVHGDTSANNTISLMAAPFKNNIPLIQGEGQFGSRLSPVEGIGAPRYTDIQRSKAAQQFFYNDLDLVPMVPNYDGSNHQPQHFLPLIPVCLLNGVSGVAIGWSTEILPHASKDLIKATKAALQGKDIGEIKPYYQGYDIDVRNIAGNQWELTGKVELIDSSTLRITELPPNEKFDNFKAKLIKMEDEEKIATFTDQSADKIDIVVKFKRGAIKDWTEADAVKFFKLNEKITERIVVVGWGGNSIKTYDDPQSLIKEYAAWRLGWYTIRYNRLKDIAEYDLNYWLILKCLFEVNFNERLREFKDKKSMMAEVKKIATANTIEYDEAQIEKIVSLPMYRWTEDFQKEVDETIEELVNKILEYVDILADPDKLKAIYISELDSIKV